MFTYHYLFHNGPLAALALLAALNLPALAQVDVGLAPMRVEVTAVPGKPVSGSLTLTNSGSTPARFRVEMVDFYIDENTTPQFIGQVAAEAPYSCRSWLTANPMELEVAPKSQAPVRYTVRVPANATESSYHCALGFRTIPKPDEISGTAMRTAVRLMTVIYPTVGKPPVTGVIKDLTLQSTPTAAGSSWQAILLMENSGLMLYRPVGDISVVDASGTVIETMKVPSFPVLPKRQQRIVVPIPKSIAPGSYTLQANVEVGGEIQKASVVVTAAAPAIAPPQ